MQLLSTANVINNSLIGYIALKHTFNEMPTFGSKFRDIHQYFAQEIYCFVFYLY